MEYSNSFAGKGLEEGPRGCKRAKARWAFVGGLNEESKIEIENDFAIGDDA